MLDPVMTAPLTAVALDPPLLLPVFPDRHTTDRQLRFVAVASPWRVRPLFIPLVRSARGSTAAASPGRTIARIGERGAACGGPPPREEMGARDSPRNSEAAEQTSDAYQYRQSIGRGT
jgi:hypothetical protein